MNFLNSTKKNRHKKAFTLVELLAAIAIIAILASILLVGIQGASSSGNILEDQNKLRQISQWMNLYSGENKGTIVPSQFNHEDESNRGRVRSSEFLNNRYQGSWCDILWSNFALYESFGLAERDPSGELLWYSDSPDSTIFADYAGDHNTSNYDNASEKNIPKMQLIDFDHPFRAKTKYLRSTNDPAPSGPTPFGTGANEKELPGYFAANDYFDSRSPSDNPNSTGTDSLDRYLAYDQIFRVEKSIYLIDSWAGETIDYRINNGEAYETVLVQDTVDLNSTSQVDFRYGAYSQSEAPFGQCLIMLLDGSSRLIPFFSTLQDLEGTREDLDGPRNGLGWKIQRLRQRRSQ